MTTRLKILAALALATSTCSVARAQAAPLTESIAAQGGPIRITPIFHGSLQIEYRGKVIHVDPFSAGDYSRAKKADVILITHTHGDHMDWKAIKPLVSRFTLIIGPEAATDELMMPETASEATVGLSRAEIALMKRIGFLSLKNGESTDSSVGRIGAVPMYNVVRERAPGQKYHPKGPFNGYVLSLGGKRIYIAGDTEATPEMRALKNIDVAFVPMNLPYTMTPQEAASGVRSFKPKIVYPYHYRSPFTQKNSNPQQFARALQGSGIQVRIRDWYSGAVKSD